MKIQLIEPSCEAQRAFQPIWVPRLGLPMLAALTPEGVDVSIVDENSEEVQFHRDVDLVGITGLTNTIHRAYQIADTFHNLGIKTVMGGIHVSAEPEEALEHCDAVVVGEAEEAWPKLLEDFAGGRLQPIYRSESRPSLAGLPRPRWDLYKEGSDYESLNVVQATRGCPYNCTFCSVTPFFGHQIRRRPIPEVIDEVIQLKGNVLQFVDDNVTGHGEYSKDLFRAMIPVRKNWLGQSDITLADDDEMLDLARASGCYCLLVGLESISQRNLQRIGKKHNRVDKYSQAIRKIHDRGIQFYPSMMFGLDDDDEESFADTVNFLRENGVKTGAFCIVTPLPGTAYFRQLEEEDRLLTRDWSRYNYFKAVHKPKKMSVEQLEGGLMWVYRQMTGGKNLEDFLAESNYLY